MFPGVCGGAGPSGRLAGDPRSTYMLLLVRMAAPPGPHSSATRGPASRALLAPLPDPSSAAAVAAVALPTSEL